AGLGLRAAGRALIRVAGLLPARRRPGFRDVLDNLARLRTDGAELRAAGPDRVRPPGVLGGLTGRLAEAVGRRRQPVPGRRTPDCPVAPPGSRPLRRPDQVSNGDQLTRS